MKTKRKQSGVTLMEMTVVVAIVASLAVVAVPGVRMLFNSMESDGSTRAMISAAIASARAIATEKQEYVGVRFQRNYNPGDPNKASQYMIFIIHDPDKTGLADGFRAVDNVKPVKLPDNIGVMDLLYNPSLGSGIPDVRFSNPDVLRDTTTFSIVFSPSGKLVIHDVQVRNRDGKSDDSSEDEIFNTEVNVKNGKAMFYQDDYSLLGFQKEPSRNSFVIYDKVIFDKINKRWSDYLSRLIKINLNPYTGGIILTN
jgi:prepilin-type N-terminal cleavage/methylation domain-containing protein